MVFYIPAVFSSSLEAKFAMSEFVKRKARTAFGRCDYNRDGFVTRQDFELMSVREYEGRQLKSEKKEKIGEDYAKARHFQLTSLKSITLTLQFEISVSSKCVYST